MFAERILPRSLLALAIAAGCSASNACGHEPSGATGGASEGRGASPTCTVPGIERARPVELVALPRDCRFVSTSERQVLASAEEYAAAVACESSVPPSVDFASMDVHVVRYSMSPAHVGRETVDDGATVTFVTRLRHNCPDDPLPMPMDVTYGFLLPKGAERALRDATCTLPEDCP